jgi:hypothetical protein
MEFIMCFECPCILMFSRSACWFKSVWDLDSVPRRFAAFTLIMLTFVQLIITSPTSAPIRVFFTSIGSIDRSELNKWVDTLHILCYTGRTALLRSLSGAMRAFIIWAYQDWRGCSMMEDHLHELNKMAKSLSLSVEDINDTSWFKGSQISWGITSRTWVRWPNRFRSVSKT